MAHFAQLDGSNLPATILQVIVISDDDILDEDGFESEDLGIELCIQLVGTDDWVQTSYNASNRHNFAAPNMVWDGTGFYAAQPYPSWTLDDAYRWQPPIPKPDGAFIWNEADQTWDDDSA